MLCFIKKPFPSTFCVSNDSAMLRWFSEIKEVEGGLGERQSVAIQVLHETHQQLNQTKSQHLGLDFGDEHPKGHI